MNEKIGANFGDNSVGDTTEKLPINRTHIQRPNYFLGRETELSRITNIFNSKQIVILYGIGGVGKTELATEYVTTCSYCCPQVIVFKDDDDITFDKFATRILYPQEIYDKFLGLIIANKELAYGVLTNVLMQLDDNVILLIDNANQLDLQFLDNLLKILKCKIILTTRKKIELTAQQNNKIEYLEINELSKAVAGKIFQHSYDKFIENEEYLFNEFVYDEYCGNTQAIVMIAKMLKEQGVTLTDYISKKEKYLKESRFSIAIHGENKFDTVANNLCQFFKITGYVDNSLDNVYTQILTILMVTEQCGIDEYSIIKELSLETSNSFIELSNRGLINRNILEDKSVVLTMHPMVIRALTLYEIQPNNKIIQFVRNYIQQSLTKTCDFERSDLDTFRKLIERLKHFHALLSGFEPEKTVYKGSISDDDNIIDILLNEDNNLPLLMRTQDGREIAFEQVAVIPHDERLYCVLKPLDKIEGIADNEAVVFYVDEEIDPPALLVCTDEKIAIEIFKEYYELLNN
ncbi:MAG: ATP-binding protein [Clostridiales bacterium]|nr:ATP-binding protein [Clostridiales bacterium]